MDAIKSLSSDKEDQKNKRAKRDKQIEEVIQGEGGGEIDEGKYENEVEDEDESQKQILSCVLGMLSAILTLGKDSRSFKEEEALKQLLWPLQIIAYRESDIELSKLSTDVSLMLLTRPCNHTLAEEKAKSPAVSADSDKNCAVPKSSVAVKISCNEYTQPVHVGVSSDRNSNHAEFVVHPIASSSSSSSSSSTSSSTSSSNFSSSSSSSASTFTVSLLQILNEFCSSPEPYVRAMGLHYITTAIGANTQVRYNLGPYPR